LVSLNNLASQIIIVVYLSLTSIAISLFYIALVIVSVLRYDSSLEEVCIDLCNKWLEWDADSTCPFSPVDIKKMSSGQVQEFLAQLLEKKPLCVAKLQAMENTYKFNSVVNSEIRFR
jgi:hypothetical protein